MRSTAIYVQSASKFGHSLKVTVEHFNIAALKNCDPKTMTFIPTFKG